MGKKFEQHLNPLEIGVFNSAKCYFIVCIKGTKVAIFLWRGRNQTLIDYQSAIEIFVDTTFRNVSNDSIPKTTNVNRATSQLTNTGVIGLGSGKIQDSSNLKNTDSENTSLKSTFKPINYSKTPKDKIDKKLLRKELIDNLSPIKISDVTHEINLRSIVTMDNEP